jgi:ABC-type nitrate/sulfonate/bicarbonate transport system permease component
VKDDLGAARLSRRRMLQWCVRVVSRVLGPLLVSAVVGLCLWFAVADLFSFSPYVVKSPSDVWTYLFAAARLSVPAALVGVLVTDWLAIGQGIGGAVLNDIGAFDHAHLWASIIVLTAVSVLLYTLLAAAESLVLSRTGMEGRGA